MRRPGIPLRGLVRASEAKAKRSPLLARLFVALARGDRTARSAATRSRCPSRANSRGSAAALPSLASCACCSLTPPMTQLNTPYPATAYLLGFLRLHAPTLGLELTQADASLGLFLRLFCAPALEEMSRVLRERVREAGRRAAMPAPIAHFLEHAGRYVETVEPAVRFLQRRDPSLALRIAGRGFLPEGPRFAHLGPAPVSGSASRTSSSWLRLAPSAPPSRRATLRVSTSMISPMSGGSGSTRASSWHATASGWPRAPPRSMRCRRRSPASRRSSTARSMR